MEFEGSRVCAQDFCFIFILLSIRHRIFQQQHCSDNIYNVAGIFLQYCWMSVVMFLLRDYVRRGRSRGYHNSHIHVHTWLNCTAHLLIMKNAPRNVCRSLSRASRRHMHLFSPRSNGVTTYVVAMPAYRSPGHYVYEFIRLWPYDRGEVPSLWSVCNSI